VELFILRVQEGIPKKSVITNNPQKTEEGSLAEVLHYKSNSKILNKVSANTLTLWSAAAQRIKPYI